LPSQFSPYQTYVYGYTKHKRRGVSQAGVADEYNAGRKVPSSQMRRGDLTFHGPNASQHEALYLDNGMMREAPYTGSPVKVSPVRSSGMTPYVTRLIEY
jgi:cell wall-associated NlpC family hydrolase